MLCPNLTVTKEMEELSFCAVLVMSFFELFWEVPVFVMMEIYVFLLTGRNVPVTYGN
jgi:hypothetical protein